MLNGDVSGLHAGCTVMAPLNPSWASKAERKAVPAMEKICLWSTLLVLAVRSHVATECTSYIIPNRSLITLPANQFDSGSYVSWHASGGFWRMGHVHSSLSGELKEANIDPALV